MSLPSPTGSWDVARVAGSWRSSARQEMPGPARVPLGPGTASLGFPEGLPPADPSTQLLRGGSEGDGERLGKDAGAGGSW